ncbi:MAG: manganese efflux pump [Clostridia bacterium]|nr:manganese efflux pump [Clostridia bacterium]
MSWLDLVLMSVALAMDACAVAVSSGMLMQKDPIKQGLKMAGAFGLFQGLMPLLGYSVALTFAHKIQAVDHWVAFGLLAFVGGKTLWGAFHDKDEEPADPSSFKNLLLMAVATSIDALAVGASFTLMEQSGVLALPLGSVIACGVIAVITFGLSFAGTYVGRKMGDILGKKAEILGGVVLIAIGLKILLEDLLG